jgi:hypothetical protein
MKYLKTYDRLITKLYNITIGDYVKINYLNKTNNRAFRYIILKDVPDDYELAPDMIYKVDLIDDEEFNEITITSVLDKNIWFSAKYDALIKVSKQEAEEYISSNKYNI